MMKVAAGLKGASIKARAKADTGAKSHCRLFR
jgi:hypothetical protein